MNQGGISRAVNHALKQLIFIYLKRLMLVLVIAYLFSGIYKIDKDSVGVVTRFGEILHPAVPPGLHYKLPRPVDVVFRIPVKQVKTLYLSDFIREKNKPITESRGNAFSFETDIDPYCITGDNNIVAVNMMLKYTVGDPVKYLMTHKQSEYFIERTAAAIIVRQLAGRRIDEILTFGKKQIELELLQVLKTEIEPMDTGINISFLEMERMSPPENVEAAFNQVTNAKVKKNQVRNEAQGYYNRVVPQARTYADELLQSARAAKRERILNAEGQVSRFLARLAGYRQNPGASRRKLYLDFIRTLYPNLKEIRVVDGKNANTALPMPVPVTEFGKK
nr:FtsH protease activity modulator HflK [uncultured Desulfobacter sp.]